MPTTLLLTLCLALAPRAAADTFKIDPVHSTVGFSIRHLMVRNVKGTFNQFGGTIRYDPASRAGSSVEATLETSSVNTANQKRDDHLRSADFFDAPRFSWITFKSMKVMPEGDRAKIEGMLTMHGVSKPVVIEAEKLGEVKDPQGNFKVGFSGTTKVSRKDFDLTWNKALDGGVVVLGDEVTVTLDIQAAKGAAPASPAK